MEVERMTRRVRKAWPIGREVVENDESGTRRDVDKEVGGAAARNAGS